MAELSLFNVNHGFVEALTRGLRSGFMSPEDYRRISAADTLEDVRSALEETDYGTFLQDEPSPLLVATVTNKCYQKLADEFRYLKAQTVEPLTTFMEFISREKMIDNVCMIIQGALNNKHPKEIEEKMHPLGVFEGMRTIMSESFDCANGFDDVYRIFLVDTPIGPYFDEYLRESSAEKDEMVKSGLDQAAVSGILTKQDLEIMKASLKKAWLEDFYKFCMSQGGSTAEVMGHILSVEADFRVILVALNSLNTDIGTEDKQQDRVALCPNFGYLYPDGSKELRRACTEPMVRAALEGFGDYTKIYEQVKGFYDTESDIGKGKGQSIEDLIYKHNVKLYEMSFEQQYHFGVFYSWVKLKEQEIRNIKWICNMIVLNKKDQIQETMVPIFEPRN